MGFPARYVMLWEDDMLMCGDQERGTISSLFDFVDKANAASPDWTGLRLGFGGNGLVLHWSDIPVGLAYAYMLGQAVSCFFCFFLRGSPFRPWPSLDSLRRCYSYAA